MSLIDRYIVQRFLLNFAILFMLLFVFAVSIDLILQLDEFVDAAEASIGEDGGFVSLMIALVGIADSRTVASG